MSHRLGTVGATPVQVRLSLVLFYALAMSGCGSTQGPPPALSVASVSDLGTIPTNPDILGRDGAMSAAFQGYSVWLYGDTFLANPNADGRGLVPGPPTTREMETGRHN